MKKIVRKLNTPSKVQDFLDKVPFNFEKGGETYMSPARALVAKKMHCFEGAIFASLCLQEAKIKNYLIDLKVKNQKKDSDHTLCAFKINGYWGAVSKTNHSVLRWRDPIYKDYRELAMSYYHEYFLNNGEKTLKSFSRPFDIWRKFGSDWAEAKENLNEIVEALDKSPHINFVPEKNKKIIRPAGKTEIKGAAIVEWKKK